MSDQLRTNLQFHEDCSVSYNLVAGDNYSATPNSKIAPKVGHRIYVCHILVAVITDNAATQTFRSSNATPVPVAGTKASPGIGPIEFEFGPNGYAIAEGEGLNHANSGAGLAASVTIVAYYKRTAGLQVASLPTS